MSETGGEILQQEPKLSKIEAFQAFKPDRVSSKEAVRALSTQITANPELHRQVAENPYSQKAQAAIAGDEQLRTASPSDVIRAIILAEPEAMYDVEFKALLPEQKKEKLYQQIDTSADMVVRLSHYVNTNMQQLWTMTPEQIYTQLSEVAFDTADPRKVEEVYAQSQRRGFRLGIVNFIEGVAQLKPHADAFATDVKGAAQKILGKELQGTVRVESLPVGFVLYLDPVAFERLAEKNHLNAAATVGFVLHEEDLSSEFAGLAGKVVVVNNGREDKQATRDHEVQHIVFNTFLREESSASLMKDILSASTSEEYRTLAAKFKKSLQTHGKNEILAYTFNDNEGQLFFSELGINWLVPAVDAIQGMLWRNNTLSVTEKTTIYNHCREQVVFAVEQLRIYQWMRDALFAAAGGNGSTLTREKVLALLELTPVDQAGRLSKYLGLTEEEIKQQYQDDQKRDADKWKDFVSGLPVSSDDPNAQTWETMHKAFESDVAAGRKRLIPVLLHELQTTQNEAILGYSVDAVTEMVSSQGHTLSFAELDEVQRTLEAVLAKRGEKQIGAEDEITTKIEKLIKGPISMEHVDFVNNPPEWLKKEQETTESTEEI